jgi:hypothetical protein
MSSNRIIYLKGTPKEIGLAMGRALGERLERNIQLYMNKRSPCSDIANMDKLRNGAMPWMRSLPIRFQEEFEGMAEGAKLPLQRLAEWAYLEQCVMDESCSSFVCMLNGLAWVGRNNDMFVPEMWGYLAICEVKGRIPTMSFGLEGDVFTSTGFNQDKLWLHYNHVPVRDMPRADRPHLVSYVLLTEMLETCSTIQEVETMLNGIDRDDGMLLFVVDGKNNEFAIFECSCRDYVKRMPEKKWLVGTNHYCTHTATNGSEDSVSRYYRMEELVGTLSAGEDSVKIPDDIITILADDRVEKRSSDFTTVYANVACPSSGEVWHTFGGYPAASKGLWQRVVSPWNKE